MKSGYELWHLYCQVPFSKRSPAERLELIMELLNPTYIDENGIEHKCPPLITKEQALELLGFEKEFK